MTDQRSSLEHMLGIMERHAPDLYRLVTSRTLDEFYDAVEDAVQRCLHMQEDRRKVLLKADEPLLSTELADLLTRGGVPTTAEAHVNGHVDLCMKHFSSDQFRMLGECKLDHGPKYHCEGTAQLLGYCRTSDRRALSISYSRHPDLLGRLQETRAHFLSLDPCHAVEHVEDHRLDCAFTGVHKHDSGSKVVVTHLGCNLYVAPSGTKKKPKRQKRK